MAFEPPFCPRPLCSQHREPEPGFCIHYGFYQPKCRDKPLSALQYKARKLAQHAGFLHDNLSPRLPADRTYLLDEEETYEQASIRTLTMPVLIERENWFVVATDGRHDPSPGGGRHGAAPHGRTAKNSPTARARREPQVRGRRSCRNSTDGSGGTSWTPADRREASYATLSREVFGDRVDHQTTSSRLRARARSIRCSRSTRRWR
jgi:hypothetical protein